jgi:formylglycine-generating enzyme required for sulfatase activity
MNSPESGPLRRKYADLGGNPELIGPRDEWRKGGFDAIGHPDMEKPPYFGADGPHGRIPVYRVKVTEAHCFAEWLGGRLPTVKQWRKAAGWGEDTRPGPFSGDPNDKNDLAVVLENGPWPVDRGERDVSIYGCRQMASNGKEWTRNVVSQPVEIPLENVLVVPSALLQGQSYATAKRPLTFTEMTSPLRSLNCLKSSFEVSFRVVLEQR